MEQDLLHDPRGNGALLPVPRFFPARHRGLGLAPVRPFGDRFSAWETSFVCLLRPFPHQSLHAGVHKSVSYLPNNTTGRGWRCS